MMLGVGSFQIRGMELSRVMRGLCGCVPFRVSVWSDGAGEDAPATAGEDAGATLQPRCAWAARGCWVSCYAAANFEYSGSNVLIEMRLENYAVIDNLVVEFGPGLNLLTGETGAGKSILVDALALLLGDKASSDVIRAGAERAVVAAVFETEGAAEKPVAKILEANGLDESDDGSLILRREIAAGGKGRVFVNNQPATVAVLRLLAPHLATIHAQNESMLSFDGQARLGLVDAFAGSELEAVETGFAAWKRIRTRIDDLERGEQDRLRLVDLWIFQKREIEEARLQSGEDERLESEKRVLA